MTAELDPFSAKQRKDIWDRYDRIHREQERSERIMWAGRLATEFSAHELYIASKLPFWCEANNWLLGWVGRAPEEPNVMAGTAEEGDA